MIRENFGASISRHEAEEARYSARLVLRSEKLALFHEWRRRGGPVIFTNFGAARVRLACRDSRERGAAGHQSATALDAVADATDRPPEIIKAPDGSGEIFWRKGKEGEGEEVLNWVMWFRDSKSSQETQIGGCAASHRSSRCTLA
jgi:hypothetical protein